MSLRHPAAKLRPHTKAHKCTGIAQLQQHYGHKTFTCATPREIIGMAAAGVGEDFLLANEVVDIERLKKLAQIAENARVTIAVDSQETIDATTRAGLHDRRSNGFEGSFVLSVWQETSFGGGHAFIILEKQRLSMTD